MFDEKALYSRDAVREKLGISGTTLWRLVRDGYLPPPIPGIRKYSGEALMKVIRGHKPWVAINESDDCKKGGSHAACMDA
jgi:hypothetical protein